MSSLLAEFDDSGRYLTKERERRLAGELGLRAGQVRVWFQNRRAKLKRAAAAAAGSGAGAGDSTLARQLREQGLYGHGGSGKSNKSS